MDTGFYILLTFMLAGSIAWQISYLVCERWLVSTVGYQAPSGVAKFFIGKLWYAPGIFNAYSEYRLARQQAPTAARIGWVGLGSSVAGLLAFFVFLTTL
jgi:hypothetical protein